VLFSYFIFEVETLYYVMQLTQQYNSATTKKSARRKSNNSVSQFAQETFDAFAPFINIFDAGADFDGPYHTISKQDWDFFRRHKSGEKPLFYEDGTQFHPYNHVLRNIYSPEHVQNHIISGDTSYYTSGRHGLGLLYLDVDAHHKWQTDEVRAKTLLHKLFPFGYYRTSNRGQNGYLKIRYSTISEFNEAAHELETTLQKLFLQAEILCDIEIKGTITDNGKSGLLAKLPFNRKEEQSKRDETDSWDGKQLELFKNCPIVNLERIKFIGYQVAERIDEDRTKKFFEQKKHVAAKADQASEIRRQMGWEGSDDELIARLKQLVAELIPQGRVQKHNGKIKLLLSGVGTPDMQPPATDITPKPDVVPVATPATPKIPSKQKGTAEGNAFARNRRDLAPFVRDVYRKHRRFPSLEDALQFLHDKGVFSGEWSDGEERRAKRVSQILEHLKKDFDPKLLRSDSKELCSLSAGKYAWWVRNHIGSNMIADVVSLQAFDPVKLTAPVKRVSVPARFIQTFLTVADFCLNQDPLENKAVPTSRIKRIWKMVVGGAAWNQTYFQIVRDRLDKMGVVHIFDRHHDNNKAWRWDAGRNFPSETWKSPTVKLFGMSYREFIANTNIVIDEQLLNTLYQADARFQDFEDRNPDIRPPPT